MTPATLQALLGRTVRYDGHPARVEHVRLTWRRVMPPIEEVALVPLADPTAGPRWVNRCDIDLVHEEEE